MHIVYVTGWFAEKDGDILTGMPNYIYKIAKYMMEKKHMVSILTVGQVNRKWKYDRIPVLSIKVPYKDFLNNEFSKYFLYPISRDWEFNRALKSINEKCPISIVQYAGWYGVGMLYSNKYPSVLRISTYTKVQLYSKHTKKELKYISLSECLAARKFDGVISPSYALGIPFSQDTKRKVTIIATPFSPSNETYEDISILKTKLLNKRYFLFFGRISPDKGIITISRCIKQILTQYPDFYFCFAGEKAVLKGKSMLQILKSSAQRERNRVIYLGNLSRKQLYPIVRNAECVVLPSLMDNLPNAGLEAMWLNGIVIGTRGASFDEMFEDNISGFLMEIDNSDDLINKINTVMHMSKYEKDQMRLEAKKRLKRYESKIVGKELERYYQYILKKRGKFNG